MKAMETLQDLIEEAKLRTVWWALCIFAVSYFLAHTSKSMWMNVPIAILLVCGSRILLNEVEFRWKVKKTEPLTYLSRLEKKQLSVNDSRLSTLPPPPKWKRKIESPIVEAAMEDFINKLLQDFVVDLWYSDITPDKEFPELIRGIIMDVLAEISARVKNINLVDLLTRDVIDLVGVHLELFRKNQAAIGVEVMVTLSSEERDERLKHHLMVSNELHPALLSPESEYKFLKRIMGAVVAVVLKQREAQSALVRCIARELLTCLVMEPVMRFASPAYINELLEVIFLASANDGCKEAGEGQSGSFSGQKQDQSAATTSKTDHSVSPKSDVGQELALYKPRTIFQDETKHLPAADWARGLEAATQRRTEVLQPENLENMWTKGRNYKKKAQKNAEKNAARESKTGNNKDTVNETLPKKLETSTSIGRTLGQIPPKPRLDGQRSDKYFDGGQSSMLTFDAGVEESLVGNGGSKTTLRKSNSTSDLNNDPVIETAYAEQVSGSIISEFYSANAGRHDTHNINTISDKVLRIEGYSPKLKCRVMGAYFEKLGSKSFAVYSIAVTDAENNTWFVKRRYRNFERLHRQLKDIPNYTLHLPPKRIFSSNTEDAFVHQRCIQLDKYLQDLLSIANVAEQHEVWDFLSLSSKNYSFGKSSSVMRTLAVNVDDAVDDIVRQFKGVSDGLMRKVVGPTFTYESVSSAATRTLTWKPDELSNSFPRPTTSESANSLSDSEMGSSSKANGWHSDNELNSKGFPPRVVKHDELLRSLDFEKRASSEVRSEILNLAANFPSTSDHMEDPLGMPAEWTPPNVSVPLLNLVDKIFQLNRRGWLRRQVFWISKQILQLMMEDAIDDWLLRQIHWLRRDDIVAHGIRWIQDVLWPDGVFFTRVNTQNRNGSQSDQDSPPATSQSSGSKVNKQGLFEEQLEAARRASDVKKMIFNGAPTTLVSLIGHNQYKRCAKDVYYFLQSDVCLKQLAYGLLEQVIITVFPELHDIVTDVNAKKQTSQL
ncbi:putative Phox-associated domain, sorting nexin, PX domain superfamily [Helianthus debilis subsp. tardiflorus]